MNALVVFLVMVSTVALAPSHQRPNGPTGSRSETFQLSQGHRHRLSRPSVRMSTSRPVSPFDKFDKKHSANMGQSAMMSHGEG